MNGPTARYGLKMSVNQFGHPVAPDFYDDSEILAINHLERIALGLKASGAPRCTMMELGSNQAYFSLLFKGILGDPVAVNYLVEPFDEYMPRGQNHFALNGFTGFWINESIGSSWVMREDISFGKKVTSIGEILAEHGEDGLDVLHCDIDGSEMTALETSAKLFDEKKVRWVIVSTHSDDLYSRCRDFLASRGYVAEELHPTMDVGFDGLLVFHSGV